MQIQVNGTIGIKIRKENNMSIYNNMPNTGMGNLNYPGVNIQPAFSSPPAGNGSYGLPPNVNGLESVKSYGMPVNSTVMLLDSNKDIFYIKKTDSSGFPTIKAYQYQEIAIDLQSTNPVLQGDFNKIIQDLTIKLGKMEKKMEEKLNELSNTGEYKSAANSSDKTNV